MYQTLSFLMLIPSLNILVNLIHKIENAVRGYETYVLRMIFALKGAIDSRECQFRAVQ